MNRGCFLLHMNRRVFRDKDVSQILRILKKEQVTLASVKTCLQKLDTFSRYE